MSELTPENLLSAAERIITEIGEHAENSEPLKLERLEQCARVLCAQLKAVEVLESYNLRARQADTEQKYTSYEDLPPLNLEERARLKQTFIDLLSPRGTGGEGDEPRTISPAPKQRH